MSQKLTTEIMITKTEQLKPYLITDDDEFKKIVELFNDWFAETCFLSNIYWIDSNENWKKMHEYCNEHKDILKKFWLEIYDTFGEVGHFTFMLNLVFPNMVEVVSGYCPLKYIEKAWWLKFLKENGEIEKCKKI